MKVAVVGTGYVGLVVGACLAETGNEVICADVDEKKIGLLSRNVMPIFEPGLESIVARNQAAGRLSFTTDIGSAVEPARVIFIAVGTPPQDDGSADLAQVLAVAREIGCHLHDTKLIITKSTVPVGTAELVRQAISEKATSDFSVCSNPEFLKEGDAVNDFMKPDRVLVGVDREDSKEILEQLYAPFVRSGNPMIFMDIVSAELAKYAANAMLATRIAFMNEMAELCEAVGANVDSIRRGIGSDPRIGKAFLFPGPGYGGSCFPKDVRALLGSATERNVDLKIVGAVEEANQKQKQKAYGKLVALLPDLSGKSVAIWGVAFKANTDDTRESAALTLIADLVRKGATVRVHDPVARPNLSLTGEGHVHFIEDMYVAAEATHALVVMTEWNQYRNPDFHRLREVMDGNVLLDARNLYDPTKMVELGFDYDSFGRPN